jgi:hypothetical protein
LLDIWTGSCGDLALGRVGDGPFCCSLTGCMRRKGQVMGEQSGEVTAIFPGAATSGDESQ